MGGKWVVAVVLDGATLAAVVAEGLAAEGALAAGGACGTCAASIARRLM